MSLDNTLYDIFSVHHILNKVFFKDFEAQYKLENMNFTHLKTMVTLKFEGPCPMSVISEKMGLEKGSFSPVAHYLIDQGYVVKKQDENDKRVYNLELLQKGRDYTEKVFQDHLLYIEKEIDKFSQLEKDIYLNSIKLIISLTEKIHDNK